MTQDRTERDTEEMEPLSTVFAKKLRESILRGERELGARLYLNDLHQEFGISLTPIREGLTRLTVEGLIEPAGKRGYIVSDVSEEDVSQVLELRLLLEPLAVKKAVEHGGRDWEAGVVVAAHRDAQLRKEPWDVSMVGRWERCNRELHEALISGCGSPLLSQFCHVLHDRSHRHRSLFLTRKQSQPKQSDDHARIVDAALNRDGELAAQLMYEHIRRATEDLRKGLAVQARARRKTGA